MPPPLVGPRRPAIRLAGAASSVLTSSLLEVAVARDLVGLSRCEAVFDNWAVLAGGAAFRFFGRDILEFGKGFAVDWGTDGPPVFDGRLMAIEGRFPDGTTPTIWVRAEDRFADLRMTTRTRTFEQVSDADIFRIIAADHGLTPDVNLSGPTYRTLAQLNQSDEAFLHERAQVSGAEMQLDGTRLSVRSRPVAAPDVTLTWGAELRSFAVVADLAQQRSRVRVSGWDVAAKARADYDADARSIAGELGAREAGAAILESALGWRGEVVTSPAPSNAGEARAEAEALFRARARRFVRGRGTAVDAVPRVGTWVTLSRLGPLFSGPYYVTEARYLFDAARGARTEFTAEAVGLGRP